MSSDELERALVAYMEGFGNSRFWLRSPMQDVAYDLAKARGRTDLTDQIDKWRKPPKKTFFARLGFV